MRVKILDKIWTLVFVPRKILIESKWGDCDSPNTRHKKIRIAANLPPKEELETVLHEALHAADWYKDEEWVEIVARDLTRLLWRLGWRKS